MSTTLKMGYLRLLRKTGKKSLRATSVFGFPYRISLGDMFSENPYYSPTSNVGEILACAAWIDGKRDPVVFDIGAHCGFISTQLAQILKENNPVIYSFEPVAPTFSDLVLSINTLNLQKQIHPIPVALSNQSGFVTLNYSKWASMFAQIVPAGSELTTRAGNDHYIAPSNTFDEISKSLKRPDVIKIDVEGWEVPVFQGSHDQLKTDEFRAVGICLEWNPEALRQTGFSPAQFHELLNDYRFFYINDYEGQRHSLLEEIMNVGVVEHVCNLFAIHSSSSNVETWRNNFMKLKSRFNVTVS